LHTFPELNVAPGVSCSRRRDQLFPFFARTIFSSSHFCKKEEEEEEEKEEEEEEEEKQTKETKKTKEPSRLSV
jgi:CO dehydrogenase/acetyl-CoA synthase beta subunit